MASSKDLHTNYESLILEVFFFQIQSLKVS